ncbi:MAG: FAD-binding protein, partial [Clostridia bacterium]|nr:FAD-binding protein [Clostridia bacterium]
MCDFILKLKEILPEGDFKANEPLSLHSTFRIGGNADIFAKPSSEMYLVKLLKTAKENDIPYTVVGGGSNILFSDKGFKGLVITTQGLKNISSRDTFVTAESGVALPMLSSFLCRRGLGGMSFACGIPGTVGGGVFMNAGAYGGEFADVLVSSRYYDCISGKICEIANSEHNFSYRHSSYMEHSERVILSAEFSLDKGSSEVIKNECDELLRRRAEKQPLEFPSAGSTFKRYPGFFTAQLID